MILSLIGNKCDLKHLRKVSEEDGTDLAKQIEGGITFYEVSAKEGNNVTLAFQSIVEGILKRGIKKKAGLTNL